MIVNSIEETEYPDMIKLTLEDPYDGEIGAQIQDSLFGYKLYIHSAKGNDIYVSREPIMSCRVKKG